MSEMSFIWSKRTTKSLISFLEGYPELWDLTSSDYKDQTKKRAALAILSEEFKTTTIEIRRKIHNLRSQLHNEIRKIRKKNNGQESVEKYNSTWEHFEALKFMLPSMKMNNPNFTTFFNPVKIEIKENPKKPQPQKRKRKKPEDKISEQALKITNQLEDDAGTFGAFVASCIRNLKKDESKKKMKQQIQRIILQIEEEDDLPEDLPGGTNFNV